ncbi:MULTISPECIES: hypothetical protein [unclassified Arsukibacterium]|uniref:hypothetical protein n=1 Tax=unclassified Arsukibacterium TaxID=2635278 RepID=UPI0025C4462B|nr:MULTISPECIES: hypothetical protein [unclassified Arsukibacterium]|tara:strand:- start:834 stop:1646 length:813 start_codon:yes stop_codon:yes gene_type:complete
MRRDRSIALCHSDLKQSALYFDVVCPSSTNLWHEISLLHDQQDVNCELLLQSLMGKRSVLDRKEYFSSNPFVATSGYITDALTTILIEIMHEGIVEKAFKDSVHSIGETTINPKYEPEESPSLLLTSMRLVDVENLTWQKIIALREDPAAMASLKDLRNMVFADYNNKPFSYVEDQLFKRIENHEAAVKKWGMDTFETSIELILSHKNSAALAGFASTIFGAPISSAILLGASATLANVGFHLRKRRREKQQLMNLDPIRYIFKVRNLNE